MNLRVIARWIGIGVLVLVLVGFLGVTRDTYIEVNAMTGAIRTSKRFVFVYQTPWVVRGNWLAESAARQGMATDGGWKRISTVADRLGYTSIGCSRAPVSYRVGTASPEGFDLETKEEIDAFVRKFAAAGETERWRMLSGSK